MEPQPCSRGFWALMRAGGVGRWRWAEVTMKMMITLRAAWSVVGGSLTFSDSERNYCRVKTTEAFTFWFFEQRLTVVQHELFIEEKKVLPTKLGFSLWSIIVLKHDMTNKTHLVSCRVWPKIYGHLCHICSSVTTPYDLNHLSGSELKVNSIKMSVRLIIH